MVVPPTAVTNGLARRVADLQAVGESGGDLLHVGQAALGPGVPGGGHHRLALEGHLLEELSLDADDRGPGQRLAAAPGTADHLGAVLLGDGAVGIHDGLVATGQGCLIDQDAGAWRHGRDDLDVRGDLQRARSRGRDAGPAVDPHPADGRMHPVAPGVSPDVPVGVVGQLEQGHRDVLPEVMLAVEGIELVGASQPGRRVDVPGGAGRAAGPGPGNGSGREGGPRQVHGAEADDGGYPAAQVSGHPRGPAVEQRRPAVGEPHPVDRRAERRLDARHRPGGGQQQAIPQGRPGAEVMAVQPGPDRAGGAPPRTEAGLDPARGEEVAEPGRAGGGDPGGQAAQAAGVERSAAPR